MAFRNKNYLTKKFEDNDIPTGQDFSDLISSSLNLATTGSVQFLSSSLTVSGTLSASNDLYVSGNIEASSYTLNNLAFLDSQILTTSGSTVFGDTASQDSHTFTGSVFITGSELNANVSDGIFHDKLYVGPSGPSSLNYNLHVSSSNTSGINRGIAVFETSNATAKFKIVGNKNGVHSPGAENLFYLEGADRRRAKGIMFSNLEEKSAGSAGSESIWFAGVPYGVDSPANSRHGFIIGFDNNISSSGAPSHKPYFRASASFFISESGFVGINTTFKNAGATHADTTLEVSGSLRIQHGDLIVLPANTSSVGSLPMIRLTNHVNDFQSGIQSSTHLTSLTTNTAGGFYWYRSSSADTNTGTAGVNWMTLKRVGNTAASGDRGALGIATTTPHTHSIGGKDTLLDVRGNITASGVIMASASHAPTHAGSTLAVVYDTGSRQFYYTGSYGAGSTDTAGIFTTTGSFQNTTNNVGVTGSFSVKGGIYASDKIRIGGVFDDLSGQTETMRVIDNTSGMMSVQFRNSHVIGGSTAGITGLNLHLAVDSNNGAFTVYTPDSSDSATQHRVDLGSTATGAFLTFSTVGTERMRINADGKVGIGKTAGTYLLEVAGTMAAEADVIAYMSSDKRLKDNIKPIENPIEKIKQIGGYTFDWNNNQSTYKGSDVGVIAQEIEKVLPSLVNDRNDGYKGVKYDKIVSLLIEGIKDQQKQIDDLKTQIDNLK